MNGSFITCLLFAFPVEFEQKDECQGEYRAQYNTEHGPEKILKAEHFNVKKSCMMNKHYEYCIDEEPSESVSLHRGA